MGKIIFRYEIALGNGQGARPEAVIVVPVTDLNACDGTQRKQNGESRSGQVFG